MFNRYKSLMETAVKHLPCLQRGSVKQKRDIIHVFATLDEMLYSKNNELDTYSKRRFVTVRTVIVECTRTRLTHEQ